MYCTKQCTKNCRYNKKFVVKREKHWCRTEVELENAKKVTGPGKKCIVSYYGIYGEYKYTEITTGSYVDFGNGWV